MSNTVTDYGFVLAGWRPACGHAPLVGWRPIEHLGLAYVGFLAVLDGLCVTCRVDPCPAGAEAPYSVAVRRDLDCEIAKAMRVMKDKPHA